MMLFGMPGGQTVTVYRMGQRDWSGDFIEGFEVSHTIDNVLVDEEQTSADKFRRDEYDFRGSLLMAVGSDVLPTDQVELADGERVVIFGKPRIVEQGLVRGMAVKFRSRTSKGS